MILTPLSIAFDGLYAVFTHRAMEVKSVQLLGSKCIDFLHWHRWSLCFPYLPEPITGDISISTQVIHFILSVWRKCCEFFQEIEFSWLLQLQWMHWCIRWWLGGQNAAVPTHRWRKSVIPAAILLQRITRLVWTRRRLSYSSNCISTGMSTRGAQRLAPSPAWLEPWVQNLITIWSARRLYAPPCLCAAQTSDFQWSLCLECSVCGDRCGWWTCLFSMLVLYECWKDKWNHNLNDINAVILNIPLWWSVWKRGPGNRRCSESSYRTISERFYRYSIKEAEGRCCLSNNCLSFSNS